LIKVLRFTGHKIRVGHFGDFLPCQSFGVEEMKPHTTKAN